MEKKFIFKDNAFDLIRYWAAITVMLGHFVWKTAPYVKDNMLLNIISRVSMFFPGVVILFSMSGFLVSASIERSKNKKEFFAKRVLRMYPELWVCTIVNFLIVCLLAYKLLDKSIFVWILTQIFGIAYTPSCLKDFATGSVNGALWTIFTELQLYIILGIVYNWIKKFDTKKWIVLLGFLAACNVLADFVSSSSDGVVAKIIERFFLTYALWFFIGVFCYVKRERMISLLKKMVVPLLFLYVICKLLPIDIPGYYSNIAVGILLPLIVIGGGQFTANSDILRFNLRDFSLPLDCAVSAKYSCGFSNPQISPIIAADRYLDYFTTIMEDRLWQVLARPAFRWWNRSDLSMNAVRAA